METIVLLLLLGLLGAFDWISRLFSYLLKGQSILLKHMQAAIRGGMRPAAFRLNKKIRRRKEIKPGKEPPALVVRAPEGSVVGGTKTVFITELPGQKEPEPLETIELPLEDPEPPEMMDIPGEDDFDAKTDLPSESELRRIMEEALFNDGYEDHLPEDHLGGISLGQIEKAYNAIHSQKPEEEADDETLAGILHSLNGTDMFKFIIDTRESDRKAKSIMDKYVQKHNPGKTCEGKKGFQIGNYVE